jgi:hypothetical protein
VENDFNENNGVRLIINLPPRSLKSLMASIAFPAWCLGHDPSAQLLCVSYAQDLADKLARDCRSIMMSPWYRRIFPTRLARHRQAVQEFITTRQGYRLATSNGGVLTGRGADIILIDDPLKPEEALSGSKEFYETDRSRGFVRGYMLQFTRGTGPANEASPAWPRAACLGARTIIASIARCSTIACRSASPVRTCPRSATASRSTRC